MWSHVDDGEHVTGSAKRRRERRLRSMLRHERMTVAMALAEALHHTAPRGQKTARAGEEESETKFTAKFRVTPPPQPVLFSLYEEEPGGRRPASLAEPPRPQERVQRHTVEHITDLVRVAPMVQILDAPVPQTGVQLPDILSFFGALIPDTEQVIEVPKIYTDDVLMRAAVRDTQLGEQLVEVPTDPGYALAVSPSGSSRSKRSDGSLLGSRDVGEVEVFQVLSQYRIQQRLWSITLAFQLDGLQTDPVFSVVGWGRCKTRSVLDRALLLGRTLMAGLRRVVVGALSAESQCSWAAGSFSLVEAKMHVKVSSGSCATLWENSVAVGLCSRGGALYVESQGSWAVVQNF